MYATETFRRRDDEYLPLLDSDISDGERCDKFAIVAGYCDYCEVCIYVAYINYNSGDRNVAHIFKWRKKNTNAMALSDRLNCDPALKIGPRSILFKKISVITKLIDHY